MSRIAVDGFCPVCGKRSLDVEVSLLRGPTPTLQCSYPDCPDPLGITKILADPEIHHIVRFDEHGFFNVKHPLRERISGELLDCTIHAELQERVLARVHPLRKKWRVKRAGEHNLDCNWIWEEIDD